MERVLGLKLKQAAFVHAQKQMHALGVDWHKGSARVTFIGNTAYIMFNQCPGKPDFLLDWTLNFPRLADNTFLTRIEADLFAGYTLHEVGHAALTDNDFMKALRESSALVVGTRMGALMHGIWNGIEDPRMENGVIVRGVRGARSAFRMLANHLTLNADANGFNPTRISGAAFALACMGRAALGNGNAYMRNLINRIPQPKRAVYEATLALLPKMATDRTGTAQAWEAAEFFREEWLKVEPNAFDEPEVVTIKNPADEQSEQSEQSEKREPSEEELLADFEDWKREIEEAAKEARKADEKGVYADAASDEDEYDEGEGDFEDREDKAGKTYQIEEDDEAGEAEEAEAGDADDIGRYIDQTAESQEGGTQGGVLDIPTADDEPEGEEEDDSPEFEDEASRADEEIIVPEPECKSILERANARVTEKKFLPPFVMANRSYMSKWPEDVREATQRKHSKMMKKTVLPAVTEQLARLLAAPDRFGWDKNCYSGRFDIKRAAHAMAGNSNVFQRRWESKGIDTAIEIVIDLSGSMQSIVEVVDPVTKEVERLNAAQFAGRIALTLAKAAERSGAKVQISGFGLYRIGGDAMFGSTDDDAPTMDGDTPPQDADGDPYQRKSWRYRSHAETMVVAKAWHERVDDVAHQVYRMTKKPDGGTPDYPTVRTAVEQMSLRKEQRKIVMVLTDGCGYVNEMEALTNSTDLFGVEVIGIGIGIGEWCGEFDKSYRIGAKCPDYAQLGTVTLRKLANWLEKTDTRRLL